MQALAQSPALSPHRPACLVFYAGDDCDQSIQQYNQFIQQQQQQEWAAPVLKQIADQQKLIAKQQNQITRMQATIDRQTVAALQRDARERASLDFLGALLGMTLAFLIALAIFRRLAKTSTFPEPETPRAAAAKAC
jgi:hypothetical protein